MNKKNHTRSVTFKDEFCNVSKFKFYQILYDYRILFREL